MRWTMERTFFISTGYCRTLSVGLLYDDCNEDYRAFFDLLVGNDDVFCLWPINEDYKDIEPI